MASLMNCFMLSSINLDKKSLKIPKE